MASMFRKLKAPLCLMSAMSLWSIAFIAVKITFLVEVPAFLLIFSLFLAKFCISRSLFFLAFWRFKGRDTIARKDYLFLI